MKKLWTIIFLICSISLTSACEKENKPIVEKEDVDLVVEVDENQLPVIPEQPTGAEEKIVYKDDIYGFSLDIPISWQDKYTVKKEVWIDDVSQSVSFNYNNNGIYNNIFTIIIMEESIAIEEWEELFLIYIGEYGGRTFSYSNIMEPTEELLEEKNKEELEIVTIMVEDVPGIIDSFNIVK